MKFKVRIDGVEHQVEAGPDGTLILDGEAFKWSLGSSIGERRVVQLGDESYEVTAPKSSGAVDGSEAGEYVLEIAGERVPMTVSDFSRGGAFAPVAEGRRAVAPGGGAEAGGPVAGSVASDAANGAVNGAPNGAEEGRVQSPGEVKDGVWAPVPGKIVDVFVKPGDTVEEGDLLLILEAMKMENELHAPRKATVASVPVKKGDQAERGQLLVAFA